MKLPEALGVALGGALGAVCRILLGTLMPGLWGLALINALGSFVMGWRRPGPTWGTGFLGGFTSFSTFVAYTAANNHTLGLIYALTTVTACVGSWWVGDRIARTTA